MRFTSARFTCVVLNMSVAGLLGVSLTIMSPLLTVSTAQQGFPSRTITIVAPFPAGGSADFFARTVAEKVSSAVGQPVIIETKPGAGGIVGTLMVINSPADGYTLVSTSVASILVPPILAATKPFDALTDTAPITPLAKVPSLLVVNPSLGIRSLADLVKYAKANPGKLNIASSGIGTVSHLAAELLRRETKIDIVHVPYKGSPPAVTDLLGNHTQIMFSDAPFFMEHVKAGKLVALATGTSERLPQLPDVPTTAEVGYPNLIADNTYCLFAPAGTPPEVIQKLNTLVRDALNNPEVKGAYAKQAAMTAWMKSDDFKTFIREQAARWVPLANTIAAKQK